MPQLTPIASNLQNLFGEVAHNLAFTTGFRKRPSKLGGAELCRALVAGWLANPQASRSELAGIVGVSKQALDQALDQKAVAFLKQMLQWAVEQMVRSEPSTVELLARFGGVYVLDGSTLSLPQELAADWPGCGNAEQASGAGLKLHVMLDLGSGALYGPHLTTARTHDRAGPLQTQLLPKGALRLADLGYFNLAHFKDLTAQGVYFISKVPAGVQFYKPSGQPVTLSEWLAGQPSEQAVVDCQLKVGVKQKLECRVLAWRVPQSVVSQRQSKFKEQVRKRQRPISEDQHSLSYWTVYLTNVEAEKLSWQEAAVLYRLRWQIELLFKLWKSIGGVKQWHSHKAQAILAEIYAKLIGQLVQHWLLLMGVWEEPERSLVKASRVVHSHIRGLLLHLASPADLEAELSLIKLALAQSGPLGRRKKRPSSYQLILNPPLLETG